MSFGGTIKLTGESEYRRALAQIMQGYKELQSEMKLATSQFDKNDKSAEAVAAKTEALVRLIDQQKAKIDLLTARLKELNDTYKTGESRLQDLNQKYRTEVTILDELRETVGENTDEYKKQESVVRSLEAEMNRQATANANTEKAMSNLRTELNNTQSEINNTTHEMDRLGDETEDSGEKAQEAANGGFTVLKGVIANLASEAIQKAIEGVKTLASKLIEVGKESYSSYAVYEQMIGGIETLYGDSAKKLEKYAMEAYKTAGVSANTYMEQATSFAAALLQGLDGDSEKAVEYVNTAIVDMSDNINKLGNDAGMVRNAYSGFLRNQYTMLDNLKLGYQGTKAEMARLLNDTKVFGNTLITIGKEGNFDEVVTFDKVIEAIHIVQQQIGITGTTIKEAEGTISGSMGQAKAAYQNLLVAFASGNGDVRKQVQTLVDTVITMLKNAVPRVKQIVEGMWTALKTGLRQYLPEIANRILPAIQKIKDAATSLVDFLTRNIDKVIAVGKAAITMFTGFAIAGIAQLATSILTLSNPIGIISVALAGLVSVLMILDASSKKLPAEEEARRAAIAETTDRLNDNVKAWNDLKEAQDKYVTTEQSKLGYYDGLWEELKKITDENGKITEGYESRAKFITTTLADAYGVEISIVDGVIQKYGELRKTMEDVMAQKRAQVVLNAQEALYTDALENRDERLAELTNARGLLEAAGGTSRLEEVERRIAKGEASAEKLLKTGLRTNEQRRKYGQLSENLTKLYEERALLTELQASYDAARDAMDESYYYIGLYEQNYAKMQEGRYEEMVTTRWKYNDAIAMTDEARIQEMRANYEAAKYEYDHLAELFKSTGEEAYKAGQKIAENEANQYADRLKELGVFVDSVGSEYGRLSGILAGASTGYVETTGDVLRSNLSRGFNAEGDAFRNAMNGMQVVLDGEQVGRFVKRTVTMEVFE